MQMAAREAITCLRDALPSMKTRRYRYLPCHVPYTCHYAFAFPRGERDEAIELLVEYLKALEEAFDNLMDDFVAARMNLVQGCSANRRELLHTAPPLTYVSSSASYAPAIFANAPSRPTTKEVDQVIAAAAISAAPPTAPALAPQHSTSCLEPISEEEVESPAPLGLTLGRPREVFTISD